MPTLTELATDYGSITAAEQTRLDQAAVRAGVDVRDLMQIAGWQVARCAWRMLDRRPAAVAVICGGGNNGGDGLVAARLLHSWGCEVKVVVVADPARWGLAHLAAALPQPPAVDGGPAAALALLDQRWPLVVDALLGSGQQGDPREPQLRVIEAMAAHPVVAVDVPSGMLADTGAGRSIVAAAATCTLTAVKQGMWVSDARRWTGDLWVGDVGLPPLAWTACGIAAPRRVRGGELLPVPAVTG